MTTKTFNPLNVSSKFAICGLPLRVDTYKGCSHGCEYCFANNRKIMEFAKTLQIANIPLVSKKLDAIFNKGLVNANNFLDTLIADRITWHCGGMSDPLQPVEGKYHVTRDLVAVTNKYDIHILFSTKGHKDYGVDFNPDLHTFQFSFSNISDRKDIEHGIGSFVQRYAFYREMKERGFKCGIRVQPFIPGVTEVDIVDVFSDADYFTIEGLKLVPQNREHKEYLLDLLNLKKEYFTQMGLLNLKPEIRIAMYEPFIAKLKEYNIPFSLADNDMHDISSGKCCCGDPLISKSTDFNNTALIYKYGVDYGIDDMNNELGDYKDCVCNYLFTSNRQEGLKTVSEFYNERFNRKSSPFSPKFLFQTNNF